VAGGAAAVGAATIAGFATTHARPLHAVVPRTVTAAPPRSPLVAQAGAAGSMIMKFPVPRGPITELPGTGTLLAWTVDDGSSSECIRLYGEFAKASGTRLTFFVNGQYPGWAENQALLQPMIDSGQVQIGNHSYSHADLTKLSDQGIADELGRNEEFITSTFGVSAKPWYRPPFGYRNARTDAAAAAIGYTSPVMWYGTLSDSGLITEQQVVDFATTWFLPQHIVIGHANFLPVTAVFDKLQGLIAERKLSTVTLNDVFG
jgi:peptidoglycan/xylan/chitin deacetylase (PgdA/CDA1 family)